MLKPDVIEHLRNEWQDEDDFAFIRDASEEIVQKYKKAIRDGQFAADPMGVSLWASVYEWLKGLNEAAKSIASTEKERKKVRESFLFVLFNEILLPNTKFNK